MQASVILLACRGFAEEGLRGSGWGRGNVVDFRINVLSFLNEAVAGAHEGVVQLCCCEQCMSTDGF